MDLVSIDELDERWPHNDRDYLEYFYLYRTFCQLYVHILLQKIFESKQRRYENLLNRKSRFLMLINYINFLVLVKNKIFMRMMILNCTAAL
jgi:hypothetical protein